MHWGIKINTSIHAIAPWFVLVLEKQCSDKAAFSSHAYHPKVTKSCSTVPGEAGGALSFGARQCLHTQHSSGSSSDHQYLDDAGERKTKLSRVWSWAYKCLPIPTVFREERGQIWQNLKHSFGEHQELVQPGRIKMPKATQRSDRLGRMACMDRKNLATCLGVAKLI